MPWTDKNTLYEFYFDKENKTRNILKKEQLKENFTFRVILLNNIT